MLFFGPSEKHNKLVVLEQEETITLKISSTWTLYYEQAPFTELETMFVISIYLLLIKYKAHS